MQGFIPVNSSPLFPVPNALSSLFLSWSVYFFCVVETITLSSLPEMVCDRPKPVLIISHPSIALSSEINLFIVFCCLEGFFTILCQMPPCISVAVIKTPFSSPHSFLSWRRPKIKNSCCLFLRGGGSHCMKFHLSCWVELFPKMECSAVLCPQSSLQSKTHIWMFKLQPASLL